MRHALRPLLILLLSSWALGQSCTSYTVVDAVDRKTGDDVGNLNVGDFDAKMGNESLAVTSVTPNFSNRLLVLLETDGTEREKIDDVVTLATRLARQAPEGRQVAFGAFAKRSVFTNGFSGDPEERSRGISAVIEEAPSLGDRIAIYEALHNALALFGPHQPGDTVLVIADGYDDGSDHSGDSVEKEFVAKGTRLLVMLRQTYSHVTGNFVWKNPDIDRAILERMAARTGGVYTMFDAYAFGKAWRGYMVGVDIPEGGAKAHKWKLRLNSSATKPRRRLNLYYPEQLPPCASTVAQAR
jgi:hypothetical protein